MTEWQEPRCPSIEVTKPAVLCQKDEAIWFDFPGETRSRTVVNSEDQSSSEA